MDRITKGDVLVGPDVAKRLAMGLSCLNPLKLRPVSMSDIASKNIEFTSAKKRDSDSIIHFNFFRSCFSLCQVSQCNHAKTTAKQLAEMVQL